MKKRQTYNLAKFTLYTASFIFLVTTYLLYEYEASYYWNVFQIIVATVAIQFSLAKLVTMSRYVSFLEGSLEAIKQPIKAVDNDMNLIFENEANKSHRELCESQNAGKDNFTTTSSPIEGPQGLKLGLLELVQDNSDKLKLTSMTDYVSASLDETSASLEQISQTVNNNLQDAEQATHMSSEIYSISEKGDASMQKLVASMEDIKNSNERIAEVVGIIQEIEDKTKAIDEIVFQTKLLSFNASVEAERAGEHGRGFSVVAQEVGNLAQLSGKSAAEINEILKESISRVKSISDDNGKKVKEGTNSVLESAHILKEISNKSNEITDITRKVFESSREQKEGIRVISAAVKELDKESSTNLKSVRNAG